MKCNAEQGATIVEFAFSVGVLFMLLGLIFDVAFGFFRYSVLTHSISDIARETVAYSGRAQNCGRVKAKAHELMQGKINEMLGEGQAASFTFDACISGDVKNPVLELAGQFTYECVFSCAAMGSAPTLRTSSRLPLQRECLNPAEIDCV